MDQSSNLQGKSISENFPEARFCRHTPLSAKNIGRQHKNLFVVTVTWREIDGNESHCKKLLIANNYQRKPAEFL